MHIAQRPCCSNSSCSAQSKSSRAGATGPLCLKEAGMAQLVPQPAAALLRPKARCRVPSHCCKAAVSPRSSSTVPGSNTSSTTSPGTTFMRYPGEHSFNLAEYMVVLDKPLGLTLAVDPAVGQIVVQTIKEGSSAAQSNMIQVGDVVKMCSAVFGEDMWQALDIRRVRWAISNRTSKVKMVLERSRRMQCVPTWYCKGQVGYASYERDQLQLPISFNTTTSQDDFPQDMATPGRPMMLTFHASQGPPAHSPTQRMGAAAMARTARLQALREELAEARCEPEMELGAPSRGSSSGNNSISNAGDTQASASGTISSNKLGSAGSGPPSSWASTSSTNGSTRNGSGPLSRLMESLAGGMAGAASTNGTAAGAAASSLNGAGTPAGDKASRRSQAKDKKVIPVLPWLLVSSGRLDTRDLTQIASHRGLSAILELGLSRANGALAIRGSNEGAASPYPPATAQGAPSTYLAGSPAAGSSQGTQGPLAIVSAALSPRGRAASGTPVTVAQQQGGAATATAGEGAAAATQQQQPQQQQQPVVSEHRIRALINAAAALQRLAIRRAWGSVHHATAETCNVLLHCAEPGLEPDIACVLAAWLHWYAHMPLQEALLSAEIALGCAIEPQGIVEAATEALVAAAEERLNEVVLTWRYGGLTASVAGDVVGSWSTRMPLIRCKNPMGCKGAVARGNFYLELTGLRPGVYYYKYIVDGTWAVDPAAPKVLDASGNWNNVLEVHQRPPVTSSRERLALARWHARHLAWDAKMGLRPAH